MKRLLKQILLRYPHLYQFARKTFSFRHIRIVRLSGNSIDKERIEEIENNSYYNDIISDLVAYTGFSRDMLIPYLLRYPEHHYKSEFNWFNPTNEIELTWFYRCSATYLFANSIHPYQSTLDIFKNGRLLDYGAGIGCNTIGLAMNGINVDFLEISRLQADFINFRAERHKLNNIKEVLPYYGGRFDPVNCIKENYDAIIAMDVLEHIPKYHIVVKHLIDRLKPGGIIIENSPFDPLADDISIHIRPDIPLEETMIGMERIDQGIWKKKS